MSCAPEPDAATVRAAVLILFHGVRPEQAPHMVSFLLGELERLYVAGGCTPPAWLGALRQEYAGAGALPL
jgi:hypothetical protein